MTLNAMLLDLYRRLGYATSPDSGVTTRLTDFLNEGVEAVMSEPGLGIWIAQHEPRLTFASVANQAAYAIQTDRLESVTERDNDRRLPMRSLDWYRSALPDPTAITGTPEAWVPLGQAAVAVQPSDASEIFVDSTSASDTGTAYIEGYRTGGYFRTLSVTMTGTTAVSLSAAITDLVEITKFYISAAAVGTVTLHEDASGGTELARIPIGATFARYQRIALFPTPASAITYYVDSDRDLPAMSNSTDEPPWPARFHRILVDYALWKEWEKKDDTRAQTAALTYRRALAQLRYHLTCPPDFLPSRTGQVVERSRFGAWFGDTRY